MILRGDNKMKIETCGIYHIKDEFFDKINDNGLMINHENGHARPTYFTIKDRDILWFIPLSSKISKYKPIIDRKIKKYGQCKSIMICEVAGKKMLFYYKMLFLHWKNILIMHTLLMASRLKLLKI